MPRLIKVSLIKLRDMIKKDLHMKYDKLEIVCRCYKNWESYLNHCFYMKKNIPLRYGQMESV